MGGVLLGGLIGLGMDSGSSGSDSGLVLFHFCQLQF